MREITLNKNERLLEVARLRKRVSPFFLSLLAFLSALGLLSVAIPVLYEYNLMFPPVGLLIVAKILVLVGFVSFVFFLFLKNYFTEVEKENVLTPDLEKIDIVKYASLELVPILSKVNFENPNLVSLINMVKDASQILFVATELDMNLEDLRVVVTGLEDNKETLIRIFDAAVSVATENGSLKVTSPDIFYGFIYASKQRENLMRKLGVTIEDLQNVIFWADNNYHKWLFPKTLIEKLHASSSTLAEDWTSGYTPFLDQYGVDLSSPHHFDSHSSEGREKVMKRMQDVLTQKTKNKCLLVGNVGVGKESMVYELAEKIYWGETTSVLNHRRLIKLDITSMLSATSDPAVISNWFSYAFSEAIAADNVVIFIDNIHRLFSDDVNKIGSVNIAEVFLPFLSHPQLILIGTTTNANFETYIRPKVQVATNFEAINVTETDENETIRVMEDLVFYYGGKYSKIITYTGLKEIYRIASIFLSGKSFPARAIDFMDTVLATDNTYEKVDKKVVQSIAGNLLNIPIAEAPEDEKEELLNLEEKLHQRVIAQENAVSAIANALRRARTQVVNRKRPIGNFLFMGPSGVGKTELTKALAWAYFGSESKMIRMDMNEYQDVSSVDRFVGRKVVGSDQLEGGDFVKQVKENPYSVVLLDELEKCHPLLLNLFLQMLDEGYINDGTGEKISLLNCIIIATSNAGATMIQDGIRNKKPLDELKKELIEYVQRENIFRPEFINRFDDVILFEPLEADDLREIGKMLFTNMVENLSKRGYVIQLKEDALEYLVKQGYNPDFGAREMRRVFQNKVENLISRKILNNQIEVNVPYKISLEELKEEETKVEKS